MIAHSACSTSSRFPSVCLPVSAQRLLLLVSRLDRNFLNSLISRFWGGSLPCDLGSLMGLRKVVVSVCGVFLF